MHQALYLTAEHSVRLGVADSLPPGRGEIALRMLVAGICGTDRQMISGARACQAHILGHECIAAVESIGTSVSGFSPGDLVTLNPVNPEKLDDVVGHSMDGCFQERFVAGADLVGQGRLIPVPSELPAHIAVLAEPLGTILYGFELVARAAEFSQVAVFGSGPIGIMVSMLARLRGISRILMIYNRQSRFEWIVSRGILESSDGIAFSELLSRRHGDLADGFDAAFVCTPRMASGAALSLASRITRPDGVVDMISSLPERGEAMAAAVNAVRAANCCGIPEIGEYLTVQSEKKSIWVTGHRGTSADHLARSLHLLQAHPALFSRVISHTLQMRRAADILNSFASQGAHASGEPEYVKVVMTMNDSRPG